MGVYMDAANTLIAYWSNETHRLHIWFEKAMLSTDGATVDWDIYKDANNAFQSLNQVHDQLVGISNDLATSYASLAKTWSGPGADIYKKVIVPPQDYLNDLVDRAKVYAQASYDAAWAHFNAIQKYIVARNAALGDLDNVWKDPNLRDALIDSARKLENNVTQGTIDAYFNKYHDVDKNYRNSYSTHRKDYVDALNTLETRYKEIYPTMKAMPAKPVWGDVADPTSPNGSGNFNDKLKDTDGDGVPDVYDYAPNDPKTANPPPPDTKTPDLKDSDGDGVADVYDGSPDDPSTANPPAPDTPTPPDLPDSDGDGVADVYDGSPDDSSTANPPPPPQPDGPDGFEPPPPPEVPGTAGGQDNSALPSDLGNLPPASAAAPPPPPPSNLVTSPDGDRGFDLTGNGIPDVGLGGNVLPGGNLPPGSKVVRSPDGTNGVDLDGDGVADVDLGGHALDGGSGPPGGRLVTGPDGNPGFDLNGDGRPDTDVHGTPLPPGTPTPGGGDFGGGDFGGGDFGAGRNAGGQPPDGQVIPGPGAAPAPFPGRPVVGGVPVAETVSAQQGAASAAGTAAAGRYPPMMPPMMPPHVGETKERETWLQEEDDVWADDDLMVLSVLGRPSRDEDDEASEAAWEAPAEPARPVRSRPRPQPSAGGFPEQSGRRF